MKIRKVKDNEMYKFKAIQATAFEFPIDYEKEKMEAGKNNESETEEKVRGFGTDNWGAFSDDEETLYGVVRSFPFEANFDGSNVLMRGIGDVCTLPPYRRHGSIRGCFNALLSDSENSPFLLSYLYPFSYSYYRKFGYELSGNFVIWEIDFRGLKPSGIGGSIEMLSKESDLSDVKEIYKKANENQNLAVIRHDARFNFLKEMDSFKECRYGFTWKNNDGVPKGYLVYKKLFEGSKILMDCTHTFAGKNDFYISDIEGFKGLMDFALTFSSDYAGIRFALPESVDISGAISELTYVKKELKQNGMVRVLDVKRVLEMCDTKGKGSLVLQITDKQIGKNNGIFEIILSDNKNTVRKTENTPDAKMDISTFSALITGAYADIRACTKDDLEIMNKKACFDSIFYKKPSRVSDLF